MTLYTARHAHRPSKGYAYKRPNHECDQPKSKHDKPSAVRRFTALTAAAATLIGGGYIGYQHYQPGEKPRLLQRGQLLVSWRSIQRVPL